MSTPTIFGITLSPKLPVNPIKILKRNPYRRYTIETGIDYGEWCEPDVESTSAMRTPQGKVATAYFAHSGQMMSEIANILGKTEDAVHYKKTSEMAKKAWRFIATKDGRIQSDRQADYVRALAFHLLDGDEAKQAADDLNELVKKCDYHLNTGFLSTPNLFSKLPLTSNVFGQRANLYSFIFVKSSILGL